MKWFNNLRVSMKVLISCMIFIILIGVISIQGITSMRSADEAFQTFYADRFVPVRQLNLIFKGILQVRINMLQEKIAVQLNNMKAFEERIEASGKIHAANEKMWKGYMATQLTKEEEKMARDFEGYYKNMRDIAKEFVAVLRRNDIEGSGAVSNRWLEEYRKARETMDNLIGLQQTIGEELRKEQEASAYNVLVLSIVFLGVAIAMGIIITLILTRAVSGPVRKGLDFANLLAKGDLTERIDLDQKDELGQLGSALNTAADNLESLVSNVNIAVQGLAQAVEQIASGNQNLSQRTSEQASSLEEVASTIEEATSTINQNAENAGEANTMSDSSFQMASDGGVLIGESVTSINEINQTSKEIGEIITVINEIAFQTNLLALNAAVEAARAGEQGRGFAVVAGEVRNLAQRSGNAAKEIGDLIKNSVEKIEDGTEKANKSGESIKEIIEGVGNVRKIIAEISTASVEQKQGMDQINTAIGEMDSMTQQNAALVEETASASEEMSNQAEELIEMMKAFKVSEFQLRKLQKEYEERSKQTTHVKQAAAVKTGDVKMKKVDSAAIDSKAGEVDENLRTVMKEEGFSEF